MIEETHHLELIHRLVGYVERAREPRTLTFSHPLVGVEIGVDRGQLSEALLGVFPDLRLHMIDLWGEYPDGSHYRTTGDVRAARSQRKWDEIYANAKERLAFAGSRAVFHRMTSNSAASEADSLGIGDGTLDFVFVDGDHSYEGCRNDILNWAPKVKADGVFGGHDWDNPKCGRVRDGVQRAVEQICNEQERQYELGYGMTWFFKGPHHI
jgi:hypothetical protein